MFTCCLEFQDEPYLYRPLELILQKIIRNHNKSMNSTSKRSIFVASGKVSLYLLKSSLSWTFFYSLSLSYIYFLT